VRRRVLVAIVAASALAALAASTASATSAVAAPDAIACYSTQFTVVPPRTLTLTDAVAGRVVARLDYPDTVCTSAPGSSADFLTCFHISNARVDRPPARPRTRASASLWTVRASGSAPTSVCLPASRVERGPAAKPSTASGAYTCYPAEAVAVAGAAADGVDVEDTFGSSTDKLVRASRLCAPATTGAPPVPASGIYLGCYDVDSGISGSTVIVRNRFALARGAPGPRDELCMPAHGR
jgi:hypothetical protein